MRIRVGRWLAIMAACLSIMGASLPAFAHEHGLDPNRDGILLTKGNGQTVYLANGQLHAPFASGVSCGGDPASYGLETAHHGPDAGRPGKADGCYRTTNGVPPGQDVASPVIR